MESAGDIYYMCLRCRKIFKKSEMELLPGVRCPYCGYKVVVKLRPSRIARRVKAI